jgi:hypothetical protein
MKEHEPESADWRFHVIHNMNRALLDVFLKKAA